MSRLELERTKSIFIDFELSRYLDSPRTKEDCVHM